MLYRDLPILGVDIIDREHREILLFLTQIQTDKQNIGKIIDSLVDYTTTHFRHEESLMFQLNYPIKHLEIHILEHNRIRDNMNANIFDMDDLRIEQMRMELLEHIDRYDRVLASWIIRNQ
jgi:hemerythrin-like metal-binding protein